MRMRPGHTLAEALCALALGGLLAAAAGLILAAARRALEQAEARDIGGRAEREAVAVVRHALESGAVPLARGDTAVELDLLLGVGVACAVEPRAVTVPWPTGAGLTALSQLPTRDDLLALRDHAAADADWHYAMIDSVQERRTAAICSVADGWRSGADAGQPLLRLVAVDSVPTAIAAGAELRVYRRGRFALYHAGRGEWMLGWRRCHPWTAVCGPIQPVAGPLRSPGAGGFHIAAQPPGTWQLSARGAGGRGASAEVLW